MFLKRLLMAVVAVYFALSMAACGENSNTNGTLDLSASAPLSGAGTADLIASAVVTPARAGTAVTLSITQFGYNSTTGLFDIIENYSDSQSTNSAGVVTFRGHSFVQSLTIATSLQVTATCQGLSKTMNIPVAVYTP